MRDGQQRRLSIRFGRLVEEAEDLLQLLNDAAGGEATPQPADTAARDPGSADRDAEPGVRAELRQLIAAVREAAARFEVPLSRSERDALSQLEFWSAVWWTRVLDCRAAALASAGPVDPAIADSLDAAVDEIAGRLLRIQELSAVAQQARDAAAQAAATRSPPHE